MTIWKPSPEITVEAGNVEDLYRIQTVGGRVITTGHFKNADEAYRFVQCWNACRKLYNPENHINATDDYVKRLEQLRKEAVAMAGSGEKESWNFDLSTAPKEGRIWAASVCGKVILTYWDEKREQWSGFATNGKPPVAWQRYVKPDHPNVVSDLGLNITTIHSEIDGEAA